MLRHGLNEKICIILTHVYNVMIMFGYTPKDFNISLVTPIPKKGAMNKPSDYRPISVSTAFALLFESLILCKIDFDKLISSNQFGYKGNTSCKHAMGCKPNGLNPKTIGFIYKQYCQSIFRYGLEFYFMNDK